MEHHTNDCRRPKKDTCNATEFEPVVFGSGVFRTLSAAEKPRPEYLPSAVERKLRLVRNLWLNDVESAPPAEDNGMRISHTAVAAAFGLRETS